MATPSQWTIGLLDSFRLERDGVVVGQLATRKGDLLLAYLALQAPKAVDRGVTAHALWPNHTEQRARNRLAVTLHQLRAQLKEDFGLPEDTIIAGRYLLSLPSWISIDIQSFEREVASGLQAGSVQDQVRFLRRALSLYGDGLMPGVDEPWVEAERARLGEIAGRASDRLHRLLSQVDTEQRDEALPIQAPEVQALAGYRVWWGEGGSLATLARQHAAHYLALAEQAELHVWGPARTVWLDRLDVESGNLALALEWAIENAVPDIAFRLAGALWPFWLERAYIQAGISYLSRVWALDNTRWDAAGVKVVHGLGVLALQTGDRETAATFLQQALARYERFGDARGRARVLDSLGVLAYQSGDFATARVRIDESLTILRAQGPPEVRARALKNAALVEIALEEYDAAEALLREQLDLGRGVGDTSVVAWALADLSAVAQLQDDLKKATPLIKESLAFFQSMGDLQGESFAHRSLGYIMQCEGNYPVAREHYEASLELAQARLDLREMGEARRFLGKLSQEEGDWEGALDHYRRSLELLDSIGDTASVPKVRKAVAEIEEKVT